MAEPDRSEELSGIYRRIDRLIEIQNRRRQLTVINRETLELDKELAEEAADLRRQNNDAEYRLRGGKCPRYEKVVSLTEWRNLSRFRVQHQTIREALDCTSRASFITKTHQHPTLPESESPEAA